MLLALTEAGLVLPTLAIMDNTFLPKAIETVKEAIAADNSQEYEQVGTVTLAAKLYVFLSTAALADCYQSQSRAADPAHFITPVQNLL